MPIGGSPTTANQEPAEQGMVSWSFDPVLSSSTSLIPASGALQVTKLKVPASGLVSTVYLIVSNIGVALTANQSFIGLYSSTGALLSGTADQSVAWVTTGVKSAALTTPSVVTGGYCFVAFYSVGSTMPGFRVGVATATPSNINLATNARRFSVNDVGLTTALPANLAASSGAGLPWWVGIS